MGWSQAPGHSSVRDLNRHNVLWTTSQYQIGSPDQEEQVFVRIDNHRIELRLQMLITATLQLHSALRGWHAW